MHARLLTLGVALAAAVLGIAATPAAAPVAVPAPIAAADPPPAVTYYVSLGDSVAAGYQPTTGRDEPVSYSDNLYATLRQSDPNLRFVRLGCDSETTTTMIDGGGRCAYPGARSQLDYATQFLAAHRGQVRFVTEDIGSNDIYPCLGRAPAGLPDPGCLTERLATVGANLTRINSALRAAGGDGPRYVGMNYYESQIASWRVGEPGRTRATAVASAKNLLGATIGAANSATGWQTADVAGAFASNDFGNPVDVPGHGSLPRNVATICTLTWMCSEYKDIHANPAGHRVIAATFLPLLTG
ncbi:SGNH/GDSL hydrolase family protein [Rhodococcus kronopolitis]|uniref:SGNH/GDSL hydrolase family protein n=1 Tax=Rhodococcus kronopolitis TaxID=1460226 RepID=A0ABV9FMN0_9NOCA